MLDEVVEANYIGDMERENENAKENQNAEQEHKNEESKSQMQNIRVLLKDEKFKKDSHQTVQVSASSGLIITYEVDGEKKKEECDTFMVTPKEIESYESPILIKTTSEDDKLTIDSLERSYGKPSYYGTIELYVEKDGIKVINELPLELYLRGVLPSEMPADYEMEALKAQAVCARSYAYKHMDKYHFPEYLANVDDSTSFQVYNNQKENSRTNQAIIDTKNLKVKYKEDVVMTYFFSTSSGHTTNMRAWGGGDDAEYLVGVSVWDGKSYYEESLPWYKWSVSLTDEELQGIIEENLQIDLGDLEALKVTKRGEGDVALELEVCGSKSSTTIATEYDIREALGSTGYSIKQQDGSFVKGSKLLPSAFFDIKKVKGGYEIHGGGYGHGVGMSQNGANEMAKSGMGFEEILTFFYQGIEIDT